MFKKIFESNRSLRRDTPKEGELYKKVITFGRCFELRYGYYEERDRDNPICEPAIIYPDFLKEPLFNDGGMPFVTVMQDACLYYSGNAKRTSDTTCDECRYFIQGEEWFGLCACPKNKRING